MWVDVNVKVWEGTAVNDEGRERREWLGRRIEADRKYAFGTVEKARRVENVSRGSWDAAERGDPVKDFTLDAIAKTLGWPPGEWQAILKGENAGRNFAAEVARSNLSPGTKEWILRELGGTQPPPASTKRKETG